MRRVLSVVTILPLYGAVTAQTIVLRLDSLALSLLRPDCPLSYQHTNTYAPHCLSVFSIQTCTLRGCSLIFILTLSNSKSVQSKRSLVYLKMASIKNVCIKF